MAFAPARVAPVVAQRLQIPLQVLLYVGLFIFAQYLVNRWQVPLPANLVGMVMLLLLIVCRVIPLSWVRAGARWLLAEMLLFFVPAAGVLYLGLKAIGRGEKFISIGMVVMISVLVIATLLKETTRVGYLLDGNWLYMVPVFNVVAFCFSAQYIVPEMARGFADKPEKLPRAIMVGMALTFALLALVPLSVISLNGLDNISDVATISWGRALGEWAFFSANLFALCAMLTSYWGLGGSFLTNIFDQFRLGNDEQPARRLMVLLVVAIPPFVLAYSGMVSFVNALYFAGVFSGVILSIMPILMLKGARQRGDLTPGWTCPAWMTHPLIQCFIVLLYLCSAVYAIASAVGYLPAGW